MVVNGEGFGQSIPDLEIVVRFTDVCRNALPLVSRKKSKG